MRKMVAGKRTSRPWAEKNPSFISGGRFFRVCGRKVSGKEIAVKRAKLLVSKGDALMALDLHAQYANALERAGIRVPKTVTRAYKSGGRYRIVFFQERFKPDEIVSSAITRAPAEEAKVIFGKLLGQALRASELACKARQSSKATTVVDFYLENFAFRGGDVFLLDTFFPLIGQINRKSRRLRTAFSGKEPRGSFLHDLISQNIVPHEVKPVVRLFLDATKLRPELAKEFGNQLQKAVKNTGPRARRAILHWASPERLKLLKTYYGLLERICGANSRRLRFV